MISGHRQIWTAHPIFSTGKWFILIDLHVHWTITIIQFYAVCVTYSGKMHASKLEKKQFMVSIKFH